MKNFLLEMGFCSFFAISLKVQRKGTALNMSKFRVVSGLYFPVFGLNTERYCVSAYSV